MADEDNSDKVGADPERNAQKKSHVVGHLGMGCASLVIVPLAASMAPWMLPDAGCCTGVLFAIVVLLLDVGLVSRQWYARRLGVSRCLVLGITALAATGAGILIGLAGPQIAFEEVFGVPPPQGIKHLDGERQYAGVFDTDDILLRFVADAPTLNAVLAKHGFVSDDAAVREFADGKVAWALFCGEALMRPHSKYGAWMPAQPMTKPVLYRLNTTAQTRPSSDDTRVLWDASTGQTLVHRLGM